MYIKVITVGVTIVFHIVDTEHQFFRSKNINTVMSKNSVAFICVSYALFPNNFEPGWDFYPCYKQKSSPMPSNLT